jgi:hypothetical protein
VSLDTSDIWFDYNGNGRIDIADIAWLFNNLSPLFPRSERSFTFRSRSRYSKTVVVEVLRARGSRRRRHPHRSVFYDHQKPWPLHPSPVPARRSDGTNNHVSRRELTMWILDTTIERDRVALWGPGGAVERVPCPPSFLMTLSDPARHWELMEALDVEFGAEPVTVRTIHEEWPGWRVRICWYPGHGGPVHVRKRRPDARDQWRLRALRHEGRMHGRVHGLGPEGAHGPRPRLPALHS